VKHQRFVGTGYFDAVQQVITSGTASTTAMQGSTEAEQFEQSPNANPANTPRPSERRVPVMAAKASATAD
jgi:hypothetical protein